MLKLLNSKSMSLDDARFSAFEEKVSSTSIDIKWEKLPPTSCTAEEHLYKVFRQVQQWNEKTLDPIAWGWELKKRQYFPVMTLKAIPPKDLLDNVSCKCAKSGCGKACNCRKANRPCAVEQHVSNARTIVQIRRQIISNIATRVWHIKC